MSAVAIETSDGIPWLVLEDELKIKKVLELIPSANYDKLTDQLRVPYSYNNTRVLAYIGVSIRGFEYLTHNYDFPMIEGKFPALQHQVDSAGYMVTMGKCFNLSEPRTGKSATCIGATDFLRQQSKITSTLVVAPLSTLYSVWVKEIEGMLPDINVAVLHSKKHTNAKKAEYFKSLIDKNYEYYIINPAGIKNKFAIEMFKEARLDQGHFNCIIVDESSEYGNQSTANWKALNSVKDKAEYLWLLTGTPGGAETVHGQARLVNPNNPILPKNKAIWKGQTMTEVSENVWIHRPEADDMIREVLNPAIKYTREQVLGDMPEERTVMVPVPMEDKAEKVYEALQRDMLVTLSLETDTEVRAPNAGVLVSKLLQISSGTLITDDNYVKFDISLKIENIERIMREGEGKTIIVCPFTKTIKRIEEELIERGYKVAVTQGSTSAIKRGEIFTDFQNNPDGIEVLITHPIVVQYGVELGSASNLIFWSVPMIRPGSYKQVKDRLYSSKQKALAPTCFLMYSTSLERRMFSNLENKVSWETSLSDYFKNV